MSHGLSKTGSLFSLTEPLRQWYVKISSALLLLPGVNTLFRNSYFTAKVYADALYQNKKTDEAIRHLVKFMRLKRRRNKRGRSFWRMMHRAVMYAQSHAMYCNTSIEKELKALKSLLPHPHYQRFEREAAFCHIGLGVCAFQRGWFDEAIDYFKRAAEIDKSWGYAQYLMGWLGHPQDSDKVSAYLDKTVTYHWDIHHKSHVTLFHPSHEPFIKQHELNQSRNEL